MTKTKKQKKLFILDAIAFLLSFQAALSAYTIADYLRSSSGAQNISIFFLFAYGGSFYVLINLHHLIKKYGKSRITLVMMLFKVAALLGMAIFAGKNCGIVFAIWSMMAGALMWAGLDILVENFSKNKTTGETRGIFMTIRNTGFILAPFLATLLVENFGFPPVFFLAALITSIATLIIFIKFQGVNHNMKSSPNVRVVFAKMKKKKNIGRIYYVSFMLDFFYAMMVVYTPLYLLDIGMSWTQMGKIFTVMLIPFVFLQYPTGLLADRKTGEREWLLVSYVILVIFTGAISFIDTTGFAIWATILFITRMGAAIIEILRDSYFFKQIGPRDVDIMDFYRTTGSVAYISSMFVFGLVTILLPTRFIFLVLAVILISVFVPLWQLKDTR